MLYYIIKIFLSAIIVVVVSEIAKRSSLLGGLIASLPLTSILALIWLYFDTRSIQKVINLSQSIFWLVLPSLILFVILPILLKKGINFYLSLTISAIVMMLFYGVIMYTVQKI
ncbi:MAG: DUF3147 family protein [Candidatus Mcinerneyibacterium aminivorans]|uniref:DUF3147 family protein n=1 Tax=Candidatus Mcinerneyibacterium aminivorans TaxID=2703815 RepID=A0A5D0MFW2_9BACT|nr:MAG: DUF3147 family protein [Candidatus Mcinerneyibacterium aminivorans]